MIRIDKRKENKQYNTTKLQNTSTIGLRENVQRKT